MKGTNIFFLAVAVFFLTPKIILYGQDASFRHFTTSHGLASSTIYGGCVDKQGLIWFGTDAGVSSFDGKTFKNYTISDGLSDNEVLNIKQDSKGRIWFMGFNGTLSYYYKGKIYNPSNDPLLREAQITGSFRAMFYEDRQQRIWIDHNDGYLVIDFDKKKARKINNVLNHTLLFDSGTSNALYGITSCSQGSREISYLITITNDTAREKTSHYIFDLSGHYRYPDGSILFLSCDGFVLQKEKQQQLLAPFPVQLQNQHLPYFEITSERKLWISSSNGIYCFDLDNLKAAPFHYLRGKTCGALFKDHEGNIWAGTLKEGIYMIPSWHQKVKTYNKDAGLSDNNVTSVFKSGNGKVYAGFHNGRINVLADSVISSFPLSSSTHSFNRITNIADYKENIIIGMDHGLSIYNTKTNNIKVLKLFFPSRNMFYSDLNIKDIFIKNNELFASSGQYILHFKMNEDLVTRLVSQEPFRNYCIYSDNINKLWYGTNKGLCSYIDSVEINHSNEYPLFSKRINDITQLDDSTMVFLTYGYGIVFYKNKVVKHISVKNGLSSDICRTVYKHKDVLYISTPQGLNVIKWNNGAPKISHYNTSTGLASNNVNDVVADDDHIYVATSDGLNIIPANSAVIKETPPPLFIRAVYQQDSSLNLYEQPLIPYRDNTLRFHYTAVAYQMPDNVVYHYRLKEEQDWTETKNNSLDFAFLPPGNYNFQLRARIADGPWSETKNFPFTIKKPLWQTTGFLIGAAALLILGIILIFETIMNLKKKKMLAKARIEKQMADLEQQALQSMMNPHFVFNVMNSIQHYINSNDKDAANLYLSEFARLIRMNLEISSKRYIPLEEELNYLELYLRLESLRFTSAFKYQIHVAPEIDPDEILVPVMLIQPFLENAIWHGILPQSSGTLTLEFKKNDVDTLLVSITDTGVGINEPSKSTHKSLGMKLIRQRLELIEKLSGKKTSLQILKNEPTGTRVLITLPAELDFT